MLIHSSGARWSLWAKVGAVGNAPSVVHGKPAGGGASRIVHKSTAPFWPVVLFCECMHSPSPLRATKLVPEHLRVHAFAFVAKPEQLPERTSHDARMEYDKRSS